MDQPEKIYRELLEVVGEDPDREGLQKTPKRCASALRYLTSGYDAKPADILRSALFKSEGKDMVVLKNVEFYSLCEHHMLPFFGKCHLAYIPSGHIVGLSKLPRVIESFSRRLQVQERMTHQIAEVIYETLRPEGVAVVMDALHLCMAMRGVHKQSATTVTSTMLGVFRESQPTRKEFFDIIGFPGGR